MRTYPKLPTPSEINASKRLRGICNWFDDLNERMVQANQLPDEGLSESTVAEIAAQNFDRGDLMAIRMTPHQWTLKSPYTWLWILHRYQNQYSP